MPKCTVCSHPERYVIDRALLAHKVTYESLSHCYGVSTSALYRHRRHLQENISQARQRLKNNLSLGFLFKLNNFLDRTENASRKAEAEDNIDQVLKASRVGNRLIRDLSKMDVPWDSDTVYRLMASPQWTGQDILLPTDPAFLATGHQTLADAFFQPCPEPPPSPDLADDDASKVGRESDAPPAITGETANYLASHPTLSSLPPELLADLHPDLLETLQNSLSLPPDPATPPPPQREISAKSARKSRSTKNIIEINQQDMPVKKSSAPKRRNQPGSAPPEAPAAVAGQPPAAGPLKHESLFDRIWRLYAAALVPPSSSPSSDSPDEDSLPAEIDPVLPDPESQPETGIQKPETENQSPETSSPELETAPSPVPSPVSKSEPPDPGPPDPNKPLNYDTHPVDWLFAVAHGYRRDNPPKHIPDRRWEEDFGNPRRFRGAY